MTPQPKPPQPKPAPEAEQEVRRLPAWLTPSDVAAMDAIRDLAERLRREHDRR